jgi:hypothetical protein
MRPWYRRAFHRRLTAAAETAGVVDRATGGRIALARRQARGAKLVLVSGATLLFGVSFFGVRAHAAGHAKGRLRPLGAPAAFERAVRRSILAGGQIAPPQQPPQIVSGTS